MHRLAGTSSASERQYLPMGVVMWVGTGRRWCCRASVIITAAVVILIVLIKDQNAALVIGIGGIPMTG